MRLLPDKASLLKELSVGSERRGPIIVVKPGREV